MASTVQSSSNEASAVADDTAASHSTSSTATRVVDGTSSLPHNAISEAPDTGGQPSPDGPALTAQPLGEEDPSDTQPFQPGWRFWAVFAALIASTLLSALDGSIVATALPTIASDLNIGADYVWVVNVYFLTGATFQPLFGQLSDLWGRRWIFLSILVVFTVGSGLCGGANSSGMLIAARAIQGIGAGGINMMVDLIICDLVPMRDRGKYLGMMFGAIGLFTAVGPLIGGALAGSGNWRWAFYLNLPIGGLSLVATFLFMHTNVRSGGSFAQKLGRVDWVGNVILTAACIAIMYAVTYGGTLKAWSDGAVAGPLSAGLVGLVIFVLFEGSRFVSEPLTPYHLFSNRTSAAAFAITFLHAILGLYIIYVYAVYFQAVLGASQLLSGVYLMPTVISFPIAAMVGGGLMTKFGRYKPIHLVGFALLTLGCGLSSILGTNPSPAEWVFFQIFMGAGVGATMTCLLPAVQARLRESDVALSTGTWAFIRSLGVIWAVTIPAAVFNNRFDQLLPLMIQDENVRGLLGNGQAYAHATAELVDSFGGETTEQVRQIYNLSIQRVWQISVVFSGTAFLLALLEKEVTLRQELKTDFGLQEDKKEADVEL